MADQSKIKIVVLVTFLLTFCYQLKAQETVPKIINSTEMKSPMLGLRTAGIKVPDLAKAKEWYTKAFQTKPYFDEPFYVGFNIGGYELGLLPEEEPITDRSDNVIVYWGVEDIQQEYDRLIELGASGHEAPNNVGGDLMVASVRDPWGNVVGIIYNPYFKLEE